MQVIREKASRKVLHIDYRPSTGPLPGEALYPEFSALTMEVGWTDGMRIPAYFDIDHEGRVVPMTVEEAIQRGLRPAPPDATIKRKRGGKASEGGGEDPAELEQLKRQLIETLSQTSFELRARLIPDYKLQNAALGVYDEQTVASYRTTVEAFRDEFHRVRTAIEKATSRAELERLKPPEFPGEVLPAREPRKK